MTRLGVIQLGLGVFALGGLGYLVFRLIGVNGGSAGIASEALLVLIVLGWTGSYLFRVVSGKMTFMEQRKRYRKAYEDLKTSELQERFASLPKDEQIRLMKELESDKE
ncbi:DUF3007 family protein [Prochlorococcus sp. MIT 1341]|uniref:DUF3007 family protein n=1 Tax=Prochlorococcus sp. MIT 1341 TaxID=3096221 RepID=UPI002A758D57|nr:DUF3007 family protein [Prochlorococcus sp. MIT 1341]